MNFLLRLFVLLCLVLDLSHTYAYASETSSEFAFKDTQLLFRYNNKNLTPYSGRIEDKIRFKLSSSFNLFKTPERPFETQVSLAYVDSFGEKGRSKKDDAGLMLNEAQINGTFFSYFNISLGRQFWNYREGHFFSDKQYYLKPQSFDGVKGGVSYGIWKADVLYAIIRNNIQSSYQNSVDRSITGLYNQLAFDFNFLKTDLDIYGLQYLSDHVESSPDFTNNIIESSSLGLRLGLNSPKISGLLFSYEYIIQRNVFTVQRFYNTHHLEIAHLSYAFGPSKTSLSYYKSSPKYLHTFGETHNQTGILDLFLQRNLEGIGLQQTFLIFDKSLCLQLQYNQIKRVDDETTVWRSNGDQYLLTTRQESKDVGQEADFIISYKGFKNFDLSWENGIFFPGKYFKSIYSSKEQLGTTFQTTVKF